MTSLQNFFHFFRAVVAFLMSADAPESITPVAAGVVVPEPGTILLLGTGLLGLGLYRRRKIAS